ncbi:MAG: family 65 glycosyl hydrolase, partial [Bacillota bacterium]|nr:family 65 glycosyl hydrolase [Bacillota bacterium]
MKEGITERRIRWKSPKGNIVSIRFSRMTSFVRLSLFLIKVDITLENCNLDIKIISKHNGEVHNFYNAKDPRVAGESKQYLSTKNVIVEDNVSYILAETSCSGLKVCSSVMGKTSKQASYKKMVYKNMVEHEFVCHLSQNEELTYLQ